MLFLNNPMRALYYAFTERPLQFLLYSAIIFASIMLLTTPYYKMAVVTAPLFVLLILLVSRPHVGYYIILFLVPFGAYTELLPYGGLSISKLLGMWVVLIIILSFLLNKKKTLPISTSLWHFFMLYFLVNIISAIVSKHNATSIDNLIKLLIAYTFAAMTILFISKKSFHKTLPVIIIISSSINAILAVAGYLFNISFLLFEGERRATGGAEDPNFFAAMTIFSLPLLFHYLFYVKTRLMKTIVLSLFVINSYAVVLSFSRGGGICLAIIYILMFADKIKKLKPANLGFIGAILLIAALVSVMFLPQKYVTRLMSTTDFATDGSLGERASHVKYGLELIKDYFIIGAGPGSYPELYALSIYAHKFRGKKGSSGADDYIRAAHNTYVEIFVGTGIIGVGAYFLLLARAILNYYRAQRMFNTYNEEESCSLTRAFLFSFISLIFFCAILTMFFHKYLWAAIAISDVAVRLAKERITTSKLKVDTVKDFVFPAKAKRSLNVR